MEGLRIPAKDAVYEMTEKKSRFIGHIFNVASAEEAAEKIAGVRKKHYDATHNVPAYLLRDGTMRSSDDGEPQGTAGLPILSVLQRENITDVLCVVTRYFGGILLGAGGLTRAYSSCAKLALKEAGISELKPHRRILCKCSYHDYQVLLNNFVNFNVQSCDILYEEDIKFTVFVPSRNTPEFLTMLQNATAGRAESKDEGENFIPEKIS
ncbi:MAG: YigZ family protein [Bacillota bacterium]|nr:YigZ family protein [Bacillota bacterium]